ncbi:MAG TPA: UxaA family hydrolase [Rhizomicrobium sp.]
MTASPVIRLHPEDGVIVARVTLQPGMEVEPGVVVAERIPAGHKLATRAITAGEPIQRYGQIIGFATAPIAVGYHVHEHNCGMGDFARDYA